MRVLTVMYEYVYKICIWGQLHLEMLGLLYFNWFFILIKLVFPSSRSWKVRTGTKTQKSCLKIVLLGCWT